MRRIFSVAVAALFIGFSASALALKPSQRVRGTIESVHGNTLAVKSYNGKTMDLTLGSGTKYVWVVPAKLSDIKPGDFLAPRQAGPGTT